MTREDMIDEAVRQYVAYLESRYGWPVKQWLKSWVDEDAVPVEDRDVIRFNFWRIAMEEEWSKT
jgi:hypothetical protein